jgi:hypothetical protein
MTSRCCSGCLPAFNEETQPLSAKGKTTMDVYSSNWNEADDSNSTAAPDGWPEGMAPSGVNNAGRAMMGATKRYVDQQIPLVTGGTSTAYTLSYSVAPTALSDGMTHLLQFNAVNGAAPTLNVNLLGAKPLHFWSSGGWGAWPAFMVAIDQIVRVTYNAAAGTYRALDMPMVLNQAFSGVSAIDFTGIPANVDNLTLFIELRPSADAVGISLQTYGADGVLDVGASDYSNYMFGGTSGTSAVTGTSGVAAVAPLGSAPVDNGVTGYQATVKFVNIQAATYTKGSFDANYLDSGGAAGVFLTGLIWRNEADRITGLRVLISSGGGTFTGKATLYASRA